MQGSPPPNSAIYKGTASGHNRSNNLADQEIKHYFQILSQVLAWDQSISSQKSVVHSFVLLTTLAGKADQCFQSGERL